MRMEEARILDDITQMLHGWLVAIMVLMTSHRTADEVEGYACGGGAESEICVLSPVSNEPLVKSKESGESLPSDCKG